MTRAEVVIYQQCSGFFASNFRSLGVTPTLETAIVIFNLAV
jgi:hypothetical protein